MAGASTTLRCLQLRSDSQHPTQELTAKGFLLTRDGGGHQSPDPAVSVLLALVDVLQNTGEKPGVRQRPVPGGAGNGSWGTAGLYNETEVDAASPAGQQQHSVSLVPIPQVFGVFIYLNSWATSCNSATRSSSPSQHLQAPPRGSTTRGG